MTRLDSLGQSYTLTGLQAYESCNRNLTFIGAATISNAPALSTPTTLTAITLTATAA